MSGSYTLFLQPLCSLQTFSEALSDAKAALKHGCICYPQEWGIKYTWALQVYNTIHPKL